MHPDTNAERLTLFKPRQGADAVGNQRIEGLAVDSQNAPQTSFARSV